MHQSTADRVEDCAQCTDIFDISLIISSCLNIDFIAKRNCTVLDGNV